MTTPSYFSSRTHCPDCFQKPAPEPICLHCGFDTATYQDRIQYLPAFTRINQTVYVGRVLGEGGFGIVYCGWLSDLQESVAIKEYFPFQVQLADRNRDGISVAPLSNKIEDFQMWETRFLQESKCLWKLRDVTGIVNTLMQLQANGTRYLVMERLKGCNLEEFIGLSDAGAERILSAAEGLALYRKLLAILNKLHTYEYSPIFHRDITLRNIFLIQRQLERVKLLDFGLARGGDKHTQTMTVMAGTEGFASPEQIVGGRIGAYTDLYSLAAVIYTAVSGRLINRSLNTGEQLDITNSLPPAFKHALEKSLRSNPDQRPQSVAEVETILTQSDKAGITLNWQSQTGIQTQSANETNSEQRHQHSEIDQVPTLRGETLLPQDPADQLGPAATQASPLQIMRNHKTLSAWIAGSAIIILAPLIGFWSNNLIFQFFITPLLVSLTSALLLSKITRFFAPLGIVFGFVASVVIAPSYLFSMYWFNQHGGLLNFWLFVSFMIGGVLELSTSSQRIRHVSALLLTAICGLIFFDMSPPLVIIILLYNLACVHALYRHPQKPVVIFVATMIFSLVSAGMISTSSTILHTYMSFSWAAATAGFLLSLIRRGATVPTDLQRMLVFSISLTGIMLSATLGYELANHPRTDTLWLLVPLFLILAPFSRIVPTSETYWRQIWISLVLTLTPPIMVLCVIILVINTFRL